MGTRTPLYTLQAELGATFTDFAGWEMPLRYASELAEHRAVREAAGLFDLTHMGEIAVRGPGAGAALDFATVGHHSVLAPGRARYTMLCDAGGGVIDDLVVYRLADEEYLLVVNASNTASAFAALADRADGFDAAVDDVSSRYALLAPQGPRAAEVLTTLYAAPLDELRYYAVMAAEVSGVAALVARTGYTGEDGFELLVEPGDAPSLWNALIAAGARCGLVPAGLSARDTLRLEAGMPLYGHELDLEHSPLQAGLGRIVRFDKPGDFVGRDALAAEAARPPTRALVGLVSAGRRVPRQGYRVRSIDGSVIGTITSGAPSPSLHQPIAMAYLEAPAGAVGTTVEVDVRGTPDRAEVVPLPFYRRPTTA